MSPQNPALRFFAFPRREIDYTVLLYLALERCGVRVIEGIFSGLWLLKSLRRNDIVHFHWPSFYYAAKGRGASLVAAARWLAILALIRLRGARIVWTAHNLLPHDRSPLPEIDVLMRHVMILISTRVFVHGTHAADKFLQRFPSARRKTRIVPHGHFIEHFVPDESRAASRAALGLPQDAFVHLFIGLCKPYKNLEYLIEQFAKLEGEDILLIVGKFTDPEYERRVRDMAALDPRVRIRAGFIPDEKIARHVIASDVVVAPYRDTLTSGTAILAISLARPIVSIALGHLLDVVTPTVGELYEADEPNGLSAAMARARQRRFDPDAILAHARTFDFSETARMMLVALKPGTGAA